MRLPTRWTTTAKWVSFAWFAEQFDTRVRTSGVAIGTQFGFGLGGFAPSIAAHLAGKTLTNWVPVAALASAAALVATISALTMRETYKVHLHDLGKRGTTDAKAFRA
jgi:hypothetical protein